MAARKSGRSRERGRSRDRRSLLHLELADLGKEHLEQLAARQEADALFASGGRAGRELEELLPDPLGRDLAQTRPMPDDGGVRRRVQRELLLSPEPDRAQEPERVLRKPRVGISDGAHDAAAQILASSHEVEDLVGRRIPEHAVDREVAARGVFGGGRERDRGGMPAVFVAAVFPERRDLEPVGAAPHPNDPERLSHGNAAGKERFDLIGRGGGRDVEVRGLFSEQVVADAASVEPSLVSALTKLAQDGGDVLELRSVRGWIFHEDRWTR